MTEYSGRRTGSGSCTSADGIRQRIVPDPIDGSEAGGGRHYATANFDVSWAGNKLAFRSQRRGGLIHILDCNGRHGWWPGTSATARATIDWDDIRLRRGRSQPYPGVLHLERANGRLRADGPVGGLDRWRKRIDYQVGLNPHDVRG